PISVGDRAHVTTQAAPQAGLLFDLPERRLGLGLAVVELPLWEGPVVIGGTVDHDHVQLPLGCPAQDEPAAGSDDVLPISWRAFVPGLPLDDRHDPMFPSRPGRGRAAT